MSTLRSSILVAALFGLSLIPAAYANQNNDVNEILEQTGFNKLIQHIPDFAQSVLKQSSGALEPEMNSATLSSKPVGATSLSLELQIALVQAGEMPG